jgi:hypothetical protein
MTNIDDIINDFEDKKVLVELFKQNRNNNTRSIDGSKLSNLAIKIANSIDNKANKNTKAIAALCLLAIASNLPAVAAQKLITKAIGLF